MGTLHIITSQFLFDEFKTTLNIFSLFRPMQYGRFGQYEIFFCLILFYNTHRISDP